MDDITGLQVTAGAFGVVSVSALLMLMVQRLKDYWPTISGRNAMLAVDVMSAIVTAVVLYQIGVNWRNGSTYVSLALGTLSLGIIARGHYASAFHVKVEGAPPSSEATVPASAVDDPYAEETRKPVAYTRPMTDDELLDVVRRRP